MKRQEAKAFINSLLNLRKAATDEQAVEAPAVYPEWKENVEYKIADRVLYDKILYKCLPMSEMYSFSETAAIHFGF